MMVANNLFDVAFDQIQVDLESETLFDQFIYHDGNPMETPFADISLMGVADILATSTTSGGTSVDSSGELSMQKPEDETNFMDFSPPPSSEAADWERSAETVTKRAKRQDCGSEKRSPRHRPTSRNAARERSRVKSLRTAFMDLQNSLPAVPPNTKLSKLDVLVLATTYIAHLMKTLDNDEEMTVLETSCGTGLDDSPTTECLTVAPSEESPLSAAISGQSDGRHHRLHEKGYLHPVRKWPMRSRLYAGVFEENRIPSSTPVGIQLQQEADMALPLLDVDFDILSLPE